MAAPGVVVVYSFPYRGADEEWSQKYHFVGDAPGDEAGWVDLVTSLMALIRPALGGQNTALNVYCYEDTDDDAVQNIVLADHSISGTGGQNAGSGEHLSSGDDAAWCRWKTARENTHGRPIYLRKYWHSIPMESADTIAAHQRTALATFASSVNSASDDWPGLAGPDGVAPGASAVSTYITTRTLKRRGPRP